MNRGEGLHYLLIRLGTIRVGVESDGAGDKIRLLRDPVEPIPYAIWVERSDIQTIDFDGA